MKIIVLQVGDIDTNCYIVYCEKTLETVIIDPGGDSKKILHEIIKKNLIVKYIINTHGHYDHIEANLDIKNVTGAKILIHNEDVKMLDDGKKNLSILWGLNKICGPEDRILFGSEIININQLRFEVIHTPGHTPGGICLKIEDIIFTGDTLFAQEIGRTDLPGGSQKQIIESIKNKLFILDDNIKVLPGHGINTYIGWEREKNPFVK